MLSAFPSLQLKYIFGLKSETPQVYHIDEHKVVYPAGHNVVTYNVEDRLMQYYTGLETSREITGIFLSPSKHLIAITEKSEKAICSIFDTTTQRRKKTITNSEWESEEFTCVAFPVQKEDKYLVTVSGSPGFEVVLWLWDQPRIQAAYSIGMRTAIYGVSFNPVDYTQGFFVTGQDWFRWLKYQDNDIAVSSTQLPAELSSTNYTAQAWTVNSQFLVGNDAGEIAVFSGQLELITIVTIPEFPIRCIFTFSKGFLAGSDKSRIAVVPADDSEDPANPFGSPVQFTIPAEKGAVKSISLSASSEESMVVALDNSQLYSTEFNPDDIKWQLEFSHLSSSFHSAAITGLDVCIRKPLIVTCGLDRTVRVWNYQKRQLEVKTLFQQDPLSVAFHPSGFHIVVGFADKLRLLNLFNSDIKVYKEIPIKACREVKFSHGGHLFAVASGLSIQVFNFYTADCPPNFVFKGHSGRVKSIIWAKNDTAFASTGIDGSVFEWKLYSSGEGQHVQDYFQKGICFHDLIFQQGENGESGKIYTVGTDKVINVISESVCQEKLATAASLGQILLSFSGKMLFTGLNEQVWPGSIRCYKFEPFSGEYVEYQAHSKPVERLRVSYDDTHLFSVGQDGTVCIFEVKDRELRRRERELQGITLSDELIITRNEIDDFHTQIDNLNSQVADQNNYAKLNIKSAIQEKEDHLGKLKEQITTEGAQSNHRYDILQEEKRENEAKSAAEIKTKQEDLAMEKQELETEYQQKIVAEVNRYADLMKEKEAQAKQWESKISGIELQNRNTLQDQADRHKIEIEEEDIEIERVKEEIAQQLKKQDEQTRQIADENLLALRQLKDEGFAKVYNERSECSKSKGGLSIETKKFKVIQDELEHLQAEMKVFEENYKNNEETINKLQLEKAHMQQDIADRDNNIGEKESKIFQLKRKNQELEKFKYVLDYKIKELRKDIEPREDEIQKMKEQTGKMDKQLKSCNNVNENQGLIVEDLKMRQEKLHKEISLQRAKIRESKNTISNYKTDMTECVSQIQDYPKLKESIIQIYQKYVKDGIKPSIIDTEMQSEYKYQRMYLENNASNLKKKYIRRHTDRKQDGQDIMNANMSLINELQTLRERVKSISHVRRQAEIMTNKLPRSGTSMLTYSRQNKSALLKSSQNESYKEEVFTQREEIDSLKQQIEQIENQTRSYTPGQRLQPMRNEEEPRDDYE